MGCAWNAVSAFANCGHAVAHVRGSYVPPKPDSLVIEDEVSADALMKWPNHPKEALINAAMRPFAA